MSDSSPNQQPDKTELWDKLAKLLHSDDGFETAALLKRSGLLKGSANSTLLEASETDDSATVCPRAIGPWGPKLNGINWQFERKNNWDKYMWLEKRDILTSEKGENVYRVCLVGESVAAGMFFSPNINPAQVLNSILNQDKPNKAGLVEVIDLSRNAMRVEMLIDVIDAAAQLNPDVIVVFAGNNFCRDHTLGRPDQKEISQQQIHAANKQGATGLVDNFTKELTEATSATLNTIVRNAKYNGSKLLWLIPTTNPSWQRLAPVHWLGNGHTPQWHELFNYALYALKQNNYKKALKLALTMLNLDDETNPTTHRLLNIAYLGLGQTVPAAKHAQSEIDVDAALQRNSFLSPGIQSCVKTLIAKNVKQHGFTCIDLETVFSEYNNTLNASGELFVDYCHLTVKGMQVAMSAVAAYVPNARINNWKDLLQSSKSFPIAQKHVARGMFEAAIYTSHMQHNLHTQNYPIHLRQRFSQALNLWEGLRETMTEYVRMRHGAVTTEVSKYSHQIVASANSLLDYGILQWIHGIDSQTIEAICGALDDAGHDGKALLNDYQQYDNKKLLKGIDLTNPRYIKYYCRDGLVDWDPERGTYRTQPYLRAYWPQLPLVFSMAKAMSLNCRLTCRVPHYGEQEKKRRVHVSINGQRIAEFTVTHNWTQNKFSIAAELVRKGFNDIQIDWPTLPSNDNQALKNTIEKFQIFGRADWYPIFGEVFSFHIMPSTFKSKYKTQTSDEENLN